MDITEERFAKLEEQVNKIVEMNSSKGDDGSDGDDTVKNLDELTDSEIENLSRRQFAQLLSQSFGGQLKSLEKRLTDELSTTKGEVSRTSIMAELKEVAQRHPEIKFLRDELKGMMEDNPDLSIQRMVNLIKVEQPDKYEEAVKKHEQEAKGDDKGDDADKGDDKEKGGDDKAYKDTKAEAGDKKGQPPKKEGDDAAGGSGGGLPPSGAGGGSGEEAEGKQSAKEATEAAWSEIIGDADHL